MAIPISGIEYRNADNAHAWGDDETDVWIGINTLGQAPNFPRNSTQLKNFLQSIKPLGWLAEDGIPIETEIDSTDFNALQGSAVIKTKITKVTRSFQIQALEENARVTKLYWDHDTPRMVAAGEAIVDIPNTISTLNCWAVLQFVEGEYWKVYVFPSVDVTDRGTLDHTNTALSIYQMTMKIKKAGWLITNNPAYIEAVPEGEADNFDAANE